MRDKIVIPGGIMKNLMAILLVLLDMFVFVSCTTLERSTINEEIGSSTISTSSTLSQESEPKEFTYNGIQFQLPSGATAYEEDNEYKVFFNSGSTIVIYKDDNTYVDEDSFRNLAITKLNNEIVLFSDKYSSSTFLPPGATFLNGRTAYWTEGTGYFLKTGRDSFSDITENAKFIYFAGDNGIYFISFIGEASDYENEIVFFQDFLVSICDFTQEK